MDEASSSSGSGEPARERASGAPPRQHSPASEATGRKVCAGSSMRAGGACRGSVGSGLSAARSADAAAAVAAAACGGVGGGVGSSAWCSTRDVPPLLPAGLLLASEVGAATAASRRWLCPRMRSRTTLAARQQPPPLLRCWVSCSPLGPSRFGRAPRPLEALSRCRRRRQEQGLQMCWLWSRRRQRQDEVAPHTAQHLGYRGAGQQRRLRLRQLLH